MTREWKLKLKPAGILLLCYFFAPYLLQAVLGAHDRRYNSITVSDLLQLGLGAALLRNLSGLREGLKAELTGWLEKKGQPRAATLELAGRISTSAGYLGAAALLLPPLGGMFPAGGLLTLAKFCAVGYTAYMACVIWKLSEPFLAYVPPPEPAPLPEETRAVPLGRCARCGQAIDASMKVCAFCGEAIKQGRP